MQLLLHAPFPSTTMQALQCSSASSRWAAVSRRCVHTSPRPRHRTACRAASSGGDGFDEHTRRALREAAELLAAAQELAQQQTVAELLSSWSADAAQQQQRQQAAAPPPSSDAALLALLLEQGLSERQAAGLLASLRAEPELAPCLAGGVLAHKLQQLGRVLPETDVASLVLQEPRLLAAGAGQLVAALVALVQGLPGRDVMSMVARRPRLLLLGDMPARLARIVAKLVALHPSHSEAVIAGALRPGSAGAAVSRRSQRAPACLLALGRQPSSRPCLAPPALPAAHVPCVAAVPRLRPPLNRHH